MRDRYQGKKQKHMPKSPTCSSSKLPPRYAGSKLRAIKSANDVQTGANVSELFTEIAKTIPIEAAQPKPAAGAAAGNRRSGAGQEQVNLGEGQQGKKGGCC